DPVRTARRRGARRRAAAPRAHPSQRRRRLRSFGRLTRPRTRTPGPRGVAGVRHRTAREAVELRPGKMELHHHGLAGETGPPRAPAYSRGVSSVPAGTLHLTDRAPQVSGAEMVSALVPPPQFDGATFETYRADPHFPSQQDAKDLLMTFSGVGRAPAKSGGLFRRREKAPEVKPGVYLDGGFGVGKTHLLASIYHAMPGRRKYFGSFIVYTALAGAIGCEPTDGHLRA